MCTELWGRQANESKEAFAAFAIYRDLGPKRSCARVGQELGKSKTLMARWSAQWEWVRRAAAWDEQQDIAKRKATLDEVQETARRHVRLAMMIQEKIVQLLIGDETNGVEAFDVSKLTANQAVHWMKIGVAMERRARGMDLKKVLDKDEGPVDDKLYFGINLDDV